MAITLSEAGSEFIRSFEGYRDLPYQDGAKNWSVGYGQLIDAGQAEKWKDGISRQDALKLFDNDIARLIIQLSKCPLATLLQHQIDSVVSLSYNIGIGAFLDSQLYREITVKSLDLSGWLAFIYDNKKHVESGLVRRRHAELRLFIYGAYQV